MNVCFKRGQPVIFLLGTSTTLPGGNEQVCPLVLYGRTVGYIANQRIRMPSATPPGKDEFAPATKFSATPTEEEATWLLAIAILQVLGFHLMGLPYMNQPIPMHI